MGDLRLRPRRALAVGLLVAAAAGCGGDESSRAPEGDARAQLELMLDKFARAAATRDAAGLCALVAGDARRVQGCGTELEDVGPALATVLRSGDDIRVLRQSNGYAALRMPSFQGDANYAAARTVAGRWRVVRLFASQPLTRHRR